MKTYYYGEPSRDLLRLTFKLRSKAKWLHLPLTAIVLIIWAILIPPSWLMIKAGDFGHTIAEWCGFESRDW